MRVMALRWAAALSLLCAWCLPAEAQQAKKTAPKKPAVKRPRPKITDDVRKFENSEYWIYNDLQRGLDEARESGEPLLVVLRCVP